MKRTRLVVTLAVLAAGALALAQAVQKDWPAAGHGPGAARFSPLTQITPQNVSQLGVAWTYDTGITDRNFETAPLVIGSVMYLTTPTENVVALASDTGKVLWTYDPKEPRVRVSRGLSYWPGDGAHGPRLVLATSGDGRIIELDPATGEPIPSFGDHGAVSVPATLPVPYQHSNYGFTSPAAVYKNLLIVSPDLQEGPSHGAPGTVSAFDAITGKLVWRFYLTAQPGTPGGNSWGPGGTVNRSGPSAWAPIAVDPNTGLVFVPAANPADSYYGADRPGDNLFANSVVALDAATGKLKWYYQLVHHDLADDDVVGVSLVNAGPNNEPAVAAVAKSAIVFLLDRKTGKPIFGIVNRPVPPSDVPGEHAPKTEPFPKLPPPLAIQSATVADVSTISPEATSFCTQLFNTWQNHGPFQPFLLQPTLHFPSAVGGANWGGFSYDPQLGYIFLNTSDLGTEGQMVKAGGTGAQAPRYGGGFFGRGRGGRGPAGRRGLPARGRGGPGRGFPPREQMGYHNPDVGVRFVDQSGYPCQQPPWGRLTAVNARTGHIAWQIRLGTYPELTAKGIPATGTPNIGGSMATASGLVFIGATMDGKFRAIDAKTGQQLWETSLDGYGMAFPVTYEGLDGKQYVAITVGGPGSLGGVHHEDGSNAPIHDRLIVFALGAHGSLAPAAAPAAAANAMAIPANLTPAQDAATGALIQRVCTQCHGTVNITRTHQGADAWSATVAEMIGRGAQLNASQVPDVVAYLAHHHGPPPAVNPEEPGK